MLGGGGGAGGLDVVSHFALHFKLTFGLHSLKLTLVEANGQQIAMLEFSEKVQTILPGDNTLINVIYYSGNDF